MIIFKRINELIGKLRVYTYQDIQDILVSKQGFDFHEVMEVFANKKLQIDNLIEIFRPGNAPSYLSAQQYQQQQTLAVQQYQQNQQQNQQQEIIQHYYPSFIQQGQQFTAQNEQQQQQQEVIEIEDENGQKNISGSNGNINIKQLAQLNIVQQEDDNEINKLSSSSSQMDATKNRERSLSPLHHRQKDAQQKSIDNNKKGYEQKMQKQSYSLSNDPKSKPIRSKSPNSNNDNKSRSITPQKNLNLNQ